MNNLKYFRGRFSKNMTYRIIFSAKDKRLHYIPYFGLPVTDILRTKLPSLTEMSPGQISPFAPNDDGWKSRKFYVKRALGRQVVESTSRHPRALLSVTL